MTTQSGAEMDEQDKKDLREMIVELCKVRKLGYGHKANRKIDKVIVRLRKRLDHATGGLGDHTT